MLRNLSLVAAVALLGAAAVASGDAARRYGTERQPPCHSLRHAASGAASVPLSLPTRGGRTLRVSVSVSDAVGNETNAVRKIRVPS